MTALVIWGTAVAIAFAATVLLVVIGWPASMYQNADMTQFWLAPRTLLEGRTPYDVWNWPYPLWTAVALLPFGLVPLEIAAAAWLVIQALAVAFVVWLIARAVLVTDLRRDGLVLAALAVSAQPVWLLVGGGNMTGLLFAAFGGALVARVAGRPVLAGALLGLLVTKPLAFLVSAPVLALAGPERMRVLVAAAAVAGALVGASFLVQPGWVSEWVGNAVALQTSTGSNATGWTVARAAPAVPPLLTSAVTVFGATTAFAAWWWMRRPRPLVLVGAAIPVSLYIAPHGWSYDQLHLLITYAVILELLSGLPRRERVLGLLAVALVAVLLPWVLYARAFTTGGETLAALTPLLAFALVIGADARALRVALPACGVTTWRRMPGGSH